MYFTDSPREQVVGPMATPSTQCKLGLCCQFAERPIKFRHATATRALLLPEAERRVWLGEVCLSNLAALLQALQFCADNFIGGFRIGSWLFPVATHPQAGYRFEELPQCEELLRQLSACQSLAATNRIRLTFHPDQFVVLNSPRGEVVANAVRDLEHHARLAECLGADVINLHAGGAYGDKRASLDRLAANLRLLSFSARSRLTIENDDAVYSPAELIDWCRREGVPLVYDVHHHRCLSDRLSVEEATHAAIQTWNREPLFHISSPIAGWSGPFPERHHDYIDWCDFPISWLSLPITVEVEAKAKELAVLRLRDDLQRYSVYSRRRQENRSVLQNLAFKND